MGKSDNTTDVAVYCINCGVPIDDFIGWRASPDWYGETRYAHHCLDCMEAYYDELAEKTSKSLALFYCCIAYNIPLEPTAIPKLDSLKEPWKAYLDRLRQDDLNIGNDDEPTTFFDGVTDILKLFGGKMSDGEFSKAILSEGAAAPKKPGTKRQRKNWGENEGYQDADFKELDRLYEVQSQRHLAGGISKELELTLRNVCKWSLQRDKLIKEGTYENAQKINNMIEKSMESNALRKKDEKPMDDIRADSMIISMEKRGYARDGIIYSKEKLIPIIQAEKCTFHNAKDMVDQFILLTINTRRKNEGAAELIDLPDELMIDDPLGECLPYETEKEKELKRQLGLHNLQKKKKDAGADI